MYINVIVYVCLCVYVCISEIILCSNSMRSLCALLCILTNSVGFIGFKDVNIRINYLG